VLELEYIDMIDSRLVGFIVLCG